MGKEWRDCILTLIDLADTTNGAEKGTASTLMRRLHRLVSEELRGGTLPSVDHAYVWNDSVLVLSHVTKEPQSFGKALRDVHSLKERVDTLRNSYAIAVKGQPFPPVDDLSTGHAERVTVLKASSWAMANCFLIEEKLKDHGASWYIDEWIVEKVQGLRPAVRKEPVVMLPKRRRRKVHLYKGELWCEGDTSTPRLSGALGRVRSPLPRNAGVRRGRQLHRER